MPRMYATGSPFDRRPTAAWNRATWSSPTRASGAASSDARSTRRTCPKSSSASSRGDSDPLSRSASIPWCSRLPTVSESDDDVEITLASEHLDRDWAVDARELHVDECLADAQVAHAQAGHRRRQGWPEQLEASCPRVRMHAQGGADEMEDRSGGPRLRRTRDRVWDR